MQRFIPGQRMAVITTLVLSACSGDRESAASRDNETPPATAVQETVATQAAPAAQETVAPPPAVVARETATTIPPTASVQVVTDATFQAEVVDAKGLVLVDFRAAWCGPCRMIRPVVEQMAREYTGRLKVTSLDVDANQETASHYKVKSLPTLLLFKDGKPVDEVIGPVARAELERKIQEHL
ncbi:MAG TPA: thioredoxin [Longimicrobium sp.]